MSSKSNRFYGSP